MKKIVSAGIAEERVRSSPACVWPGSSRESAL